MLEITLDDLIHQYMDDEIEFDSIVDFCDRLEVNECNKEMLISCIKSFDIDILYKTLFDRFKMFLSDSEIDCYKNSFALTFDLSIYPEDYLE